MWRVPCRPRMDTSAVDKETGHVDAPRPDTDHHQRPAPRDGRRVRPAAPARRRPPGPQGAENPCGPRTPHRYPGVVRTSRGGASPGMIGRGSELGRLARLASAREPAVAIIAGEPGIGKTRLVHELLATLPAETVVLVGQAEPGSLSR